MNNIDELTKLNVGEKARVYKLLATGTLRRRLQDLGIIEGTVMECVQKSPFGDPAAYLIRGAVFALRCEDSNKILVKK